MNPSTSPPQTYRKSAFKADVVAARDDSKDTNLQDGQFRALVSVFGNLDSYGDVIAPGAFTESLAEWEASGDPIPVIWSHKWDDPFAHIGTVISAVETDRGLEIVGEISAEERQTNPLAERVYVLLKQHRVRQFSFAYDVLEAGQVEHDGNTVTQLQQLRVHEVGPCLVGVNQATELQDIKSATPDSNTPHQEAPMSQITPDKTIPKKYQDRVEAEHEKAQALLKGRAVDELSADERSTYDQHVDAATKASEQGRRSKETAAFFEDLGKSISRTSDGIRPPFRTSAEAFGAKAAESLTAQNFGSGRNGVHGGHVRVPGLLTAGKADQMPVSWALGSGTTPVDTPQTAFERTQPAFQTRGFADLVSVQNVDDTRGERFTWLTETRHESNASVVPHGQKKPVSAYEMVEHEGQLKWIATLSTPIHRSMLNQYEPLKDFLATRMSEDLRAIMEHELMYGDGTKKHLLGLTKIDGVLDVPFNESLPRTLRDARTRMSLENNQPTAWLMHPADAAEVDLYTDSNGQFVSLQPLLSRNTPVVESPVVPRGIAVLADWTRATLFTDSMVDISVMDGTAHYDANGNIDGTLWEYNEIALRAEMRVGGLAITRPSGFALVKLTADAEVPAA